VPRFAGHDLPRKWVPAKARSPNETWGHAWGVRFPNSSRSVRPTFPSGCGGTLTSSREAVKAKSGSPGREAGSRCPRRSFHTVARFFFADFCAKLRPLLFSRGLRRHRPEDHRGERLSVLGAWAPIRPRAIRLSNGSLEVPGRSHVGGGCGRRRCIAGGDLLTQEKRPVSYDARCARLPWRASRRGIQRVANVGSPGVGT